MQYAGNLTRDIKKKSGPHTSGGLFPQGLHAQLWGRTVPTLQAKSSNSMWHNASIPFNHHGPNHPQVEVGPALVRMQRAQVRAAHHPRGASRPKLPTRMWGLRHTWAYSLRLPGCQNENHVHQTPQHSTAVKRLAKIISRGLKGGSYMVMDAGREDLQS